MNDKKQIAVIIAFENMESAYIPCEYIGTFLLNGLEIIEKAKDEAEPRYIAKQFVISINRSYKEFNQSVFYNDVDKSGNDYPVDYLRDSNNILTVTSVYADGSKSDFIYIDWFYPVLNDENGVKIHDPQHEHHNKYQRSKVNKHGDLFIEVSENIELDNIFPNDVINADDYTVGEMRG
jgi:hypothetical protein